MSLGALGHLGTTLGSQRLTCAFQDAILEDFSSSWGPHSEPNNHTGGLLVGMGACNDVFLEGPQNKKFPWPTPHAADPSLCSMSFLGTSWHDSICIGSLVLSY